MGSLHAIGRTVFQQHGSDVVEVNDMSLFAKRSAPAPHARALVQAGALLLDVRSPEEFAAGHIAGAMNLPVQQLEQRRDDLGSRERPVVVYCRSGARSAQATSLLRGAGFAQVHDLGAMHNW
jgi:phage shock protein E